MRALYLLAGCIVTSAMVLAGCVGVGYTADRPDRFDPEPVRAAGYVEVFTACRKAGLEVQGRAVGDVVYFSCSPTLPSLGIGPAVARARR